MEIAKQNRRAWFPKDGTFSDFDIANQKDMYDSNVFYVYAMDCNDNFKERQAPRVWYDLKVTSDDSHFSHEDGQVLTINLLMFTVFTLLLGFSVKNYWGEY